MDDIVSTRTIIAALKDFCAEHATQRVAAKKLGMTAPQLSTTLRGRNNVIPLKVLKKLGFEAVVVYRRKESKKQRAARLAMEKLEEAALEEATDSAAADTSAALRGQAASALFGAPYESPAPEVAMPVRGSPVRAPRKAAPPAVEETIIDIRSKE